MTYAPEYAIWEKKDKNGNVYLSLKTIDGQWVTLFKNKYATGKAPTWKQAKTLPDAADKQNAAHNFGPPPGMNDEDSIPF